MGSSPLGSSLLVTIESCLVVGQQLLLAPLSYSPLIRFSTTLKEALAFVLITNDRQSVCHHFRAVAKAILSFPLASSGGSTMICVPGRQY